MPGCNLKPAPREARRDVMRASSGPELLLSAWAGGAAAPPLSVPPGGCCDACDAAAMDTRLEVRDSGPSAASPPVGVPVVASKCAAARGDRNALLRGENGDRNGADDDDDDKDDDPGACPGDVCADPDRANRAKSSFSLEVDDDSARPVESDPAGRSVMAVNLLSWASMVAAPTPMLTR